VTLVEAVKRGYMVAEGAKEYPKEIDICMQTVEESMTK
jgi:hypothetical protein